MEITVTRRTRTETTTISDFVIGDKHWFNLEDKDRGLTSDMSLDEIKRIKVPKKTAIPTGRYRVTKYKSPKHGWCLLINNVPGFSMIEIHAGNFADDTDGCSLPGKGEARDMVTNSRQAVDEINAIVFPVLDRGEEVWITYK